MFTTRRRRLLEEFSLGRTRKQEKRKEDMRKSDRPFVYTTDLNLVGKSDTPLNLYLRSLSLRFYLPEISDLLKHVVLSGSEDWGPTNILSP